MSDLVVSPPARRSALRHAAGAAVSLACLALVLHRTDLASLRDALARLDWRWLPAALASLAVGYATRVHRWAVMLRAGGARVRGPACAAPFVGSVALNNVLPFRTGDAVRALVFPVALGVPRATAAASIVLERVLDLLTLVVALGVGLALAEGLSVAPALARTVAVAGGLGALAVAALVLLARRATGAAARAAEAAEGRGRRRAAAVLRVAERVLAGLGAMSRPREVALLFALSAVVWIGEAGVFLALLAAFGLGGGPAAALAVTAIATLATLVPSSPGHVGPFHLAAFSAVAMLGASDAQAASFAVVAHLALWIPTTLVGAVAIALHPGLFRAARRSPSLETP